MTDFDRIRNIIIKYEFTEKMTEKQALQEICKICFGRKLNKK